MYIVSDENESELYFVKANTEQEALEKVKCVLWNDLSKEEKEQVLADNNEVIDKTNMHTVALVEKYGFYAMTPIPHYTEETYKEEIFEYLSVIMCLDTLGDVTALSDTPMKDFI